MVPFKEVFFLLLGVSLCSADQLHAFATSDPLWKHQEHPMKPSKSWGPKLKKPYPTNTWWIDAVLDKGSNPLFNRPYSIQMYPLGPVVACARKYVAPNGRFIAKWAADGVQFGFNGVETLSRQVTSYDDMSVNVQYTMSGAGTAMDFNDTDAEESQKWFWGGKSNKDDHQGKVKPPKVQPPTTQLHKYKSHTINFPVVRGAPYSTAIYQDIAPALKFIQATLLSVDGKTLKTGGGKSSGDRFTLTLSTSQKWIVYSSIKTDWIWDNFTFAATGPGKGTHIIRIAALPWNHTGYNPEAILDKYKDVIPVGGSVDIDVDDTSARFKINWITTGGSGDPLVVALPHMQDLLPSSKYPRTGLVYNGLMGNIVGLTGGDWQWTEKFVPVEWQAPRPIPTDFHPVLIEQIKKDLTFTGMAPDAYSFGKGACRIARLALIAEALNQDDLKNKALDVLESAFNPWIYGTGMNQIRYDTTWGGTCPKWGLDDIHQDFGAGWYNDHHFHFGYWLYAASVLAKGRPEYMKNNSNADYFIALARDIANPSNNDPYFPRFRHFDFFVGHSWAAGLMPFFDGRNQESSSECLNAWYGLALFGKAIGNKDIERTGRMLLASEMRGAKKYWHSTTKESVYPVEFAKNKGPGMIWGDKVEFGTWFGSGPIYALAINMIPFTPVSEFYLTKDWVEESYPVLDHEIKHGGYNEDWRGFVYMAHAVLDPKAAWSEIDGLGHYDDGNSRTNALWWVATRPGRKWTISNATTASRKDEITKEVHASSLVIEFSCLLAMIGSVALAVRTGVRFAGRPRPESQGLLDGDVNVPSYGGGAWGWNTATE